MSSNEQSVLSLACLGDLGTLEIAVPSFSPVGSAEELALGIDDDSHLLVVEPIADQPVKGQGAIPRAFLARLVGASEIRVVYGAQRLDGIEPPDREIASRFVAACGVGGDKR